MQANIQEAKTNLSQLAKRALAGEEIIIAKAGKPILRLVPITPVVRKRKFGIDRGKFTVPENFNDPAPEFEALFYGD